MNCLGSARTRQLDSCRSETAKKEIWDLLNELSKNQREIILLKDYQGHSYAEIAEIVDIPLGTVMSRLHHARKKLATLLKECRNA